MPIDHYENFPVASVLCPPAIRPAVVAIYHFARTADDLADEGPATAAERLADLASYRADLSAALQGGASTFTSTRWPQVFDALRRVALVYQLPASPLYELLDAFEQDVHNPHYADRPALLDYCRRSANPVGRLLLHLYAVKDPSSCRQSDAVCSALQLINFWQDLSLDGPRGRHYVPESDRLAHHVAAAALVQGEDSTAVRHLVRSLCEWAESLMLEGAPLALQVPGRAGWELRLVVQGGLRILEKIKRMDYAALKQRPALAAWDLPTLLWRAARMKRLPQ